MKKLLIVLQNILKKNYNIKKREVNKMFKHEIAVNNFADAETLMEVLINNGYVVLLSKEEKLWIINYIWSENDANRNDVVFMRKDEYEEKLFSED